MLVDEDTGNSLTQSDISSAILQTTHYGVKTLTVSSFMTATVATSTWAVGDEAVTLQVSVDSSKYQDPDNYGFTITIRNHHTSASVKGDFVTPWGLDTMATVVVVDEDTGSELGASDVAWANFDYAHYTDENLTISSSLSVTLNTDPWSVGTESITLTVGLNGDYDAPSIYSFSITIRNHYTTASVSGDLTTPWGLDTTVTVIVTDKDTGSTLGASDVSWANFDYATAGYTDENLTISGSLTLTLNTDPWAVGTESVTLTVGLNGDYDNPTTYSFSITIRNHYTAASVSGDLTTPWSYKTTVTVVITDQDTGAILGASAVSSVDFDYATSSYTDDHFVISGSLELTLNTDTWAVGTESVTMTVVMNGDYDAPASYGFSITIRRHYTSVTVTGSLTSPYGNTTPVTVVVTDLDTDTTLSASTVSSMVFDPTHYANQTVNPVTSLDIVLSTESWAVGTESVLIDVSMTANYYDPDDYTFTIEICALSTYLYHEPNDLIFPNGDSFKIIIRVNISEAGPYYGEMLTGLVAANFTVHNSTYNYPFTLQEISSGRFNLTIDGSYFPEGTYTITVEFNPVNATLDGSKLVITFQYRPARSELSSPDRAVTTPYDTDFDITLNFTDVDRNAGISGATITSEGISIYDVTDLGGGQYRVTVNVSGMTRGEYYYNITADKTGYEAQTIEFKVLIRAVYTSAIPTVNALDIPVGKDPVFNVDFTDLDHNVPIDDSAPFQLTCTWIHPIIWEYTTDNRYRITFPTELDDPLQQNLFVTFTFSKGENYRSSSFNISVTVRTHNTDLRLVTAVEPTSYNANITVHLFYGDLDDQSGIWSEYVAIRVENETGVVTYYWDNETDSGEGYYIIEIPAAQFNSLGTKNFTIYFNWTGPVYSYQNKTIYVSANIVGEDSKYTLLIAAEPTPYKGNMTYVFSYAELYSGDGITNSSYGGGNVRIWVVFQGVSVDMSLIDIWEVDAVNQPGNYSIRFNTTIFGKVGVIYMEVHVDWAKGVSPFYTNRTDTITLRVLSRDTLVSVVPPSPTSYGENATFTFTYDDVTGSTSTPIAYDDTKMTVWLNLSEYMLRYSDADKTFTVSFDTTQFGAPLGQRAFIINVTWTGEPFYGNVTGRTVLITVTARQTVLDYQTPTPTQYTENVTFTVTWTDVTGSSATGIDSATITLYDDSTPIPSDYYSYSYSGNGEYSVEFTTMYYSHPGVYALTVNVTSSHFYYESKEDTRNFDVRYRLTILSAEPPERVPYNGTLEVILTFRDLYTLDTIGNDTGDVTLEIVTPGTWIYTCTWDSVLERYVLRIETYNKGYDINTQYTIQLNFSYADKSPYYSWDDTYVQFEIRPRRSTVEIQQAPVPTAYNDYANMTILYRDKDFGGGVAGGSITVWKSGVQLASGTEYIVTDQSDGSYVISILTSALDGIGTTQLTIWANWTSGVPHYGNASTLTDITVTRRPTSVEIVSPPGQTRYLENVTFQMSFVDLGTGQGVTITKDQVTVYNDGAALTPADFSLTLTGTAVYEVSIDSTVISATLVSNRNVTVLVDYPDSAPYYADDSGSVLVSIIRRDTFVSLSRPPNTAYGENATLVFSYLDITGTTSVPIEDSPQLSIVTTLSETPKVVYDSGTKSFSLSFDTAQFGDIGNMYLYLNVTWSGAPYYGNQTMLRIDVTVVERATQINFQAPSPTPYGDIVTFTVTYLDVAGSTSVGITDYAFTLYYGGSPIDSAYFDVTYGSSGDVTVELNTSYFSQPGTYELNASFVYTGTEYASDNWATRNLQVNYRPTILSSKPVGSVGYGRPLEIVLYYRDALTLDNIGTSTSFTILNGSSWDYTVTWRPQYQNWLMIVQTTGHSLTVGNQYTLHIEASYGNTNPFYGSDDVYVEFTIRNRTSVLDLSDAPLPASYLENCEFSVYYGDTDTGEGISGATISIYFSGSKIASTHYTVSSPSAGTYQIALNTTVLGGLGSFSITVVAQWPGGAPYHDDAQKTISVTVIERPTNVEIVSPPSSTKYLDNVTFTFAFTDTINGRVIDISSDNIILWGEGVQLGPDSFIMTRVGSVFEISINSTVLSPTLVTDYNLTISVDWNSTQAPYYTDDMTSLRLTTVRRAMTIEVGAIETTPLNDNITITFSVSDDDTGAPISDAIILFDCVEKHITQGANYWLTRGTGASAGTYTIQVDSSFFNATGDFHFELTVQWDPNASPYYANKTTIGLIGSVDLIWAVLSSDLPQPSSVQISQAVYVIVYYRDLDHGAIGVDPQKFTVRYLATGTEPTGLQITRISAGVYNISFSTIDITTTGSWTLNITAEAWPCTTSSVQPTFTVRVIETALSPLETSIQVNWTDTVRVWIDYKDLLHSTLVDGAYVHCTWGGQEVVFTESGMTPGRYYADIDTSLQDAGTWVVAITASKDRFATSITTVTLVVLSLPSQIVPIEPAGLSISTFRGEDTHITIRLLYIKGNSTFTIQDQYVNEISAVFEGNGRTYVFLYNGTSGFYEVTMPGTDTKDVNVGFYYFRVTAKMRNFNPASIQFALELKQTRTVLNLDYSSGTSQEMTRYYSEIVRITVNFTEAIDLSASLSNATVMWYISDIEVNGSMIEDPNRPGFYYTDLDTTIPGYGIWAITIRAIPDDPQFSNAVTSLTLTIKRIPTRVFSPVPLTVPWGWVGNLSFTYWDEIFDRPVTDANAFYSWGPYTGIEAIPLGNGTYLVPVDTTVLLPEIKWSITISFSKANFVEASGAVQLTLELIETDIEVYAPEPNRVEDSTRNLVVPMGDILNITLYYSDIEMYFGGIEGANLTADSELRGDTFSGGRPVSIVELGGGYYSFIFDTNQAFLYEYTNGTPVTGGSYRVIIGLKLDNRTTQEVTVRIRIIDVPTSVVASVQSASISLIHADQITIDLFFNDTWHSTGVTADFMQAISNNEAVLGVQIVPGSVTGHYVVTLTAQGVGTAIVEIHLGRQYYSNVSLTYVVQVLPNQTDLLVQQATIIGLPISLFVIVLLALYVKVWSVPKRVRQINGQIKALRKGRIPKPVPDARGRAEILADLFNDTYADLGITRTPAQLPEESVQVEIPEMGELLMQLSILTNLSQEELDEFKSDISKMKLSEQAAFVKEVIHQEAIRTARREGKTVDEVLKEIEQLAKRRLGDMEGEAMYGRKEEPAGETLILRPEEPEVRPEVPPEAPKFEPEGVAPGAPAEPGVPELPADRLSPFELEELRKELEAKGVPAHEIDTIVEQAKNLPRDLVDELIRSLTGDEE
ncbi:MAG: hypothetical protein ACTSUH_04550 [Candidatus Thorarchaeota archaeon]